MDTTGAAPGSGVIVLYPFRNAAGWGFLFGCTTFLALAHGLRTGLRRDASLYLLTFSIPLIVSYLYRIVEETVGENERPPDLVPEEWQDCLSELMHYVGAIVVAFLPILILLFYALSEEGRPLKQARFQAILAGLLFFGTLYFPMALLLNGFSRRFSTAFNFSVGVRGIGIMGWRYAACCLPFLASHAAWILLEIFYVGSTPRGLNAARLTSGAVTSFIGLYLSAVQMRTLGLLYRKYQTRLGWSLGSDA